jgi:hypothetical protein
MRTRSPILAILLGVSLLAGSVAVAAVLAHQDAGRAVKPFRITGHVRGLFPGRVKTMKVTIRNPYPFQIHVTSVRARVVSSSTACPAKAIRVTPWKGRLRVRAGRIRHLTLTVRMKPTAPQGCAGLRFTLKYQGKATPL